MAIHRFTLLGTVALVAGALLSLQTGRVFAAKSGEKGGERMRWALWQLRPKRVAPSHAKILSVLHARGETSLTVKELAAEAGVSQTTVRRGLNWLSAGLEKLNLPKDALKVKRGKRAHKFQIQDSALRTIDSLLERYETLPKGKQATKHIADVVALSAKESGFPKSESARMILTLAHSGNLTAAEFASLVRASASAAGKYLRAFKSWGLADKVGRGWALNAEVAAWLEIPSTAKSPGALAGAELVGLSAENFVALRNRLGDSAFVTGPVLLVLAQAARGKTMTVADITEESGFVEPLVSVALERLADKGLLKWSNGYAVSKETRKKYGLF